MGRRAVSTTSSPAHDVVASMLAAPYQIAAPVPPGAALLRMPQTPTRLPARRSRPPLQLYIRRYTYGACYVRVGSHAVRSVRTMGLESPELEMLSLTQPRRALTVTVCDRVHAAWVKAAGRWMSVRTMGLESPELEALSPTRPPERPAACGAVKSDGLCM